MKLKRNRPLARIFHRGGAPGTHRNRGLTLVELLVAMLLGLIVVLAASSALLFARQGFSTVDAASQLRDNARFAKDMIQRLAVQAGYRRETGYTPDPNAPPGVRGFDNALPNFSSMESANERKSGGNGSDVLILRNDTYPLFPQSPDADGSMIDCSGKAPSKDDANKAITSVLYVADSDGVTSLMCARSNNGEQPFNDRQPLIKGVENFQVLYGVDGVTPNSATLGAADSVPERYLRADQLTVKGNEAATKANWRRVRSLRIGMVLRAHQGSAQTPNDETIYPFGPAGTSSSTKGNFFASASDVGTIVPAPKDTRLRQVVNFTVHLRNYQDIDSP